MARRPLSMSETSSLGKVVTEVELTRPHMAVDYERLTELFEPPPDYYSSSWLMEPDRIEEMHAARLRQKLEQARDVPFYESLWSEVDLDRVVGGIDQDSYRSALREIPLYDVDDIRKSIEESPPLGTYQALPLSEAAGHPVRLYMSGGTTGSPRPSVYSEWDRQVGGILTARALYLQGVRPGDVVLNSWSYGTHNGAFNFDEALYRWLNCVVITSSTGNVTSSAKQVRLAHDYGAKAILTTGEYLLRLMDVAEELGFKVPDDFQLTALPNIGSEDELESKFGLPVLRSYGFHEVQWVAIECPAKNGLHIFEDAFIPEVVDIETGEPLPDGEVGALCITELYKTGSHQVRYNTMDLTSLQPREQCECGSWLRRMTPFAGRGDNMIKLRGINVWPEAIGTIVARVDGASDDYLVRRIAGNRGDEVEVKVASDLDPKDFPSLEQAAERELQDQLGVRISVRVVRPGSLDEHTGIGRLSKPVRFIDEVSS